MITDQPHPIDDLLPECIGEFLATLQDQNLHVRRIALEAFSRVVQNKPSLVNDQLYNYLDIIYQQVALKPTVISEVEQIDYYLEVRKAAYE
ncbi:unnamed protein product [Diabrotica balteata]|uniref:Uncharacterized protein n=1 Tax=Diabrotica balteata TaxID=107213 RepID=A0A9N9T7U8_DIABA|nr:unnamed protein product [Diabrotica balteata]